MSIKIDSTAYAAPRGGQFFIYILIVILFVVFLLRFWHLQILQGAEFTQKSHENRIRTKQVYATRGLIVAKDGTLLAENRPAYCLALTYDDCDDVPATLAQVSEWTGVPLSALHAKVLRDRQDRRRARAFEPIFLAFDIPYEQLVRIESQLLYWPGLSVITRQRRFYPQGVLFSHLLGYVGEANRDELEADKQLALGDLVGKQGLELSMEKRLRGQKGLQQLEVDALGSLLQSAPLEPALAGIGLTLTLDPALQIAAAEALGENAGCVVVLEPDTGKLRALVTAPTFDNNSFTAHLSQEEWTALIEDEQNPLYNRVIQSTYPPGSVWKLVMAGLILEQKVAITETVMCTGALQLGSRSFRCWRAGGHGRVGLTQALVQSCDVYFYEMGRRLGIDKIEAFAKKCGFGQVTGIDLPYERAGLVPSREWKLRATKVSWQGGDTLNVSIGQGATLVTPVQMALFVGSLMNGGELLKPLLLDTEVAVSRGEIPIAPEYCRYILDTMRTTVEYGTARVLYRPDAVIGGKTGTAQVVRIGEVRVRKENMQYYHRDHAWMTAWGEKDQQTYVVVVMVEHGGGGGSSAGPVVKKIFEHLFGPVGQASPPAAKVEG